VFLRAVIIAAALLLAAPAWAATTLRVAVAKSATLTIKGMDLVVLDAAGRPVPLPDAYAEVPISVKKGRLSIGAREGVADPITLESRSVYFRVNGRQYRDRITVYRDGDKLLAVNSIDMEDYLVGLINHEVSSAWSIEAVKAQAVVARTYALFQADNSRDSRYDLESTIDDQVYGGSQTEDYASAKAVRETAGEILVDGDGQVVQAFYSSNCGGITELPQNVWGVSTQIQKSVKDPWCAGAPGSSWTWSTDALSFGAKLKAAGYSGGTVTAVTVKRKTAAERALSVAVTASGGASTMSGNELRRVLGYEKLKSARFKVSVEDGTFTFTGKGAGHGVGMCQWGAKGMADGGYSYRQILGHYYTGLFLRNTSSLGPESAQR